MDSIKKIIDDRRSMIKQRIMLMWWMVVILWRSERGRMRVCVDVVGEIDEPRSFLFVFPYTTDRSPEVDFEFMESSLYKVERVIFSQIRII